MTLVDVEPVGLDAEVAELFAEVDAILCAALRPRRCPPHPPAAGCAVDDPRWVGRWRVQGARPRRGPACNTRATQRSPPGLRR